MGGLIEHDGSDNFAPLRQRLDDGEYSAFRKSLPPRYGVVWRDIVAGYVLVATTVAAVVVAERKLATPWALLVVPIASGLLGLAFHFIGLFLHEAAHGGLATKRPTNDRLCNLVVGPLVGSDIRSYRPVHLAHHGYIGTTADTERTYFNDLNVRFIVESLTGIRALRVLLLRHAVRESRPSEPRRLGVAATAALFHLVVVVTLVLTGAIWAAITWVLALAAWFPFLGSLRQLLEHRADWADAAVDYAEHDHGAFTRVFAPHYTRLFGGAGFDRHLLHHWEPTLSYTRLPDMERYLVASPVGDVIQARRTTYLRAARKLMRSGR
jgi:fatty acid desaturase